MTEQPRRPVAFYKEYRAAERAVDYPCDQGFPVAKVAIIGQDMRLVEQVNGRMDHGRAALHGAAAGAFPSALIGCLAGLLDRLDPVVSALLLALYGLIIGAIVGTLFGIPLHALLLGRRDFAFLRSTQSEPVRGRRGRSGRRRGRAAARLPAGDHRLRPHPYLNDVIRSVGAGRRAGRSSSWPRQ
ncbi:general stress protein [Streptomyces sp. NPDC048362]|uniref:general stress protein n=1 Tax=Streptomyces sp. NPDC048362 TaxID=3365539 RepID=UPI003718274B